VRVSEVTPRRYTAFAVCVLLLAISLIAAHTRPWAWAGVALFGALTAVGLHNQLQRRHAILRNYPVIGHIRWIAEAIRPEIRQYLVEADEEATPFSRSQRSLVYQRAKGDPGEHPFGTLLDPYRDGYEFVAHSIDPAAAADPASFRIRIGGPQCAQPYSASVFNISAMSFGSLSANAIRALNAGAKRGGFSHDTGEGSISPYHLEAGGDIVWEVASGYFGCRSEDGRFDPDRFAARAQLDAVKMIEIKLSQGAKPGHGGVLPAAKVTPEIAATRGVPMGQDCVSPAKHSAFSTPLELMAFITELRTLSGGKPVGMKLCIGLPWEFMGIVKAMLETGVLPDFIVVDGTEGGTGAAPTEFSDHIGTPMREGLLFVHNVLVGAGLREQLRIGVAGKIVSAFDIASVLAIGADWANSARGFMFALGCVQSVSCNTNRCPTGVATQDKLRQAALVVSDKAERVYNFHRLTLKGLSDMLAAAGLQHPDDLLPHHLVRRVSTTEIKSFDQLHTFLRPRVLVDGSPDDTGFYAENWRRASAASFHGGGPTAPRRTPA
jgi:glutamate synthase domain-containing protein 2